MQHVDIFSHHANIFDANLMIFSKILDGYKEMSFEKMAKILGLQKNFLIKQKFLHDAAKTTFCSLESPGSYNLTVFIILVCLR